MYKGRISVWLDTYLAATLRNNTEDLGHRSSGEKQLSKGRYIKVRTNATNILFRNLIIQCSVYRVNSM